MLSAGERREQTKIDFGSIADGVDLPALLRREGVEVRNGKAFCPFHDNTNTPALSVYWKGGRWRFNCKGSGCGMAGDAIAWVSAREGITIVDAARKLGGDPGYHVASPARAATAIGRPERPESWHDAGWQATVDALVVESERRLWSAEGEAALEWQATVDALVVESERRLWSAEGEAALDWLRARRLADHTIRRFRLGFIAEGFWTDPVEALDAGDGEGPKPIYAARGITIPWLAPGSCYHGADGTGPRWVGCNVRRLADPDVFAKLGKRDAKCQAFKGSKRGFLYPWPDVLPTQGASPILLVEGEFDALIGVQEVGHLLHVGTVGSASVSVESLPLATRSALALTTWIYLAFDHDEGGVDAALNWLEHTPHKARRVLHPHGKDLNEFVISGGDARVWVASFAPSESGR